MDIVDIVVYERHRSEVSRPRAFQSSTEDVRARGLY